MEVKERLKHYVEDAYACDLIDKLLWLDPSKRIDSDGALDHEFLWTDPLPCSLERMLSQHTNSMFEYLAPQRRGGAAHHAAHAAAEAARQHQQHQQNQANQAYKDGYKDMVY